jgi:hypothetical protein
VQLKQRVLGFAPAARTAVTGCLALFILVASALSISPSLHRRLHHNGTQTHDFCLICAFANGQVSTAETSPALVLIFLFFICGSGLQMASPVSSCDLRLSPSRAPPRFSFSRS